MKAYNESSRVILCAMDAGSPGLLRFLGLRGSQSNLGSRVHGMNSTEADLGSWMAMSLCTSGPTVSED